MNLPIELAEPDAALQEASLYGQNAVVLHKAKVGYARRANP